MRLPRDEGCWRGPEFAPERDRKVNPESTARALDVARGRNDGGSVFCPTGSLVHLRREFRRSCNGSELRRRCLWRGCVSARTSNPSTLAWSLIGCHRRRTGVFGQELTAPGLRWRGHAGKSLKNRKSNLRFQSELLSPGFGVSLAPRVPRVILRSQPSYLGLRQREPSRVCG